MHWIPFAMVRITTVFIAGVLAGIYSPYFPDSYASQALFLGLGILYFPAWYIFKSSSWLKNISGGIGLTTIFFAGSLSVFLRDESHFPDHLLMHGESILASHIMLTGSVEEKEKSWKRTGQVKGILTKDGWKPGMGKINLYWPKTEAVRNLDHGDYLIIKGSPRPLEGPLNPYAFDFRKFLAYKNTYHQQFIRPGEWYLASKSIEKGFLFLAHRSRIWAIDALQKFIHDPREQGIAVALVLGVTDGVDNELQHAYASSGAMHVLAVSGLHISIIYGILVLALRFLNRVRGGQWIVAAVSLVILWAYAFITGLSPSVLRAVVMFSFVVVAKPFGRRTNIYNTLAASAFCLLLYDPWLIMSVGFQLSYLAVLGIVCIYRPIYNLWIPNSRLANWAWQITCISIAAQVATLPLTLAYFHQFPVYALLSNLFVIPGSFVVLIGGIFLLLISPLSTFASWFGFLYEWFVRTFNDGIFLVEMMPGSLIQPIYISFSQAALLASFIILLLLLFQLRKFYFLILSGATIILFSGLDWHHGWTETHTSEWTVYAIKGHSAMEWREGSYALFATDAGLQSDPDAFNFNIQPSRIVKGVSDIVAVNPIHFNPVHGLCFYRWKGKTFLWIFSKNYRLPKVLSVNYIMISNQAVRSVKELANHVTFDRIIVDGTNSFAHAARLVKEAQSLNLDLSFVLTDGSFTLNF